jgi:putative ABC transport system permease protein
VIDHHLSTALRHFRRHRVTTAINVVCLALALAAVILVFGVLTHLDASDRHWPGAKRTYFLTQRLQSRNMAVTGNAITSVPQPMAALLKADFPGLEVVARAAGGGNVGVTIDADTHVIGLTYADADFLTLFPLDIVAQTEHAGLREPHTTILSEALAKRLFGGATQALGRTLLVRGREPVTVTAVFRFPRTPTHLGEEAGAVLRFEALVSMDTLDALVAEQTRQFGQSSADVWTSRYQVTYLRFPADGSFTPTELNRTLAAFAARHVPASTVPREFEARPIAELRRLQLENQVGGDELGVSPSTAVLLLACTLLAIACLNYANLATSLALGRALEIGVRRAIGAHSTQVAAQHLFESYLTTLAAVLLSLAIVGAATPVLRADSQLGIDIATTIWRDARFWVGVGGVFALAGFFAGAYPAFVVARLTPVKALQARGRAHGSHVQRWLVASQFGAVSLLAIATCVVLQQNASLARSGPSSDAAAVVVVRNSLRSAGVSYETLRERLLRDPAVEAVTAANFAPWSGTYALAPISRSPVGAAMPFQQTSVGNGYFATLRQAVLAGRVFEIDRGGDEFQDSGVSRVVLDVSATRQLGFSNPADAVGETIWSPSTTSPASELLVIGVVADMPTLTTGSGANSTLYFQRTRAATTPMLRLAPSAIAHGIEHLNATWRELAGPGAVLATRFLSEQFEESYRTHRTTARLLTGLAVLAIAISIASLVAMAMHTTLQRAREIGVRKTLGASARRVLGLLLADFSRPIVLANVLCWPLAYAVASRYLATFFHPVELTLIPFVASLVLVLSVAVLAVGAPALRAARVRPVEVLRYE